MKIGDPGNAKGLVYVRFEIYRICDELTVQIKFIKRVLKIVSKGAFGELNNVFQDEFDKILSQQSTKNVIKRASGELNDIFRTSLTKFYHSSQRMSYSFYHITESCELN